MGMKAYMTIKVESGKTHEVLTALKQLAAVRQAHICFGRPDLFCFVEASDDRALGALVLEEIQTVPGVLETATHIVLDHN